MNIQIDSVTNFVSTREMTCLAEFFRRDTWNVREALCLLCGIDPRSAKIDWNVPTPDDPCHENSVFVWQYFDYTAGTFASVFCEDGIPVPEYVSDSPLFDRLHGTQERLRSLKRIWDARSNREKERGSYPPTDYVRWAEERAGHIVTWKAWAEEQGYLAPRSPINVMQDDDDLTAKSEKSLLQIIAGLIVISRPPIRVTGHRLSGIKALQHKFESQAGIVLHRETLSRHLREAIALLNSDIRQKLKDTERDTESD